MRLPLLKAKGQNKDRVHFRGTYIGIFKSFIDLETLKESEALNTFFCVSNYSHPSGAAFLVERKSCL